MWAALGSCWDSVSCQFPGLSQQLSSLQADLSRALHAARLVGGGGGEVVHLGPRRLRVERKLGEGGYAFVYLVREVPATPGPAALVAEEPLALKKVRAGLGGGAGERVVGGRVGGGRLAGRGCLAGELGGSRAWLGRWPRSRHWTVLVGQRQRSRWL